MLNDAQYKILLDRLGLTNFKFDPEVHFLILQEADLDYPIQSILSYDNQWIGDITKGELVIPQVPNIPYPRLLESKIYQTPTRYYYTADISKEAVNGVARYNGQMQTLLDAQDKPTVSRFYIGELTISSKISSQWFLITSLTKVYLTEYDFVLYQTNTTNVKASYTLLPDCFITTEAVMTEELVKCPPSKSIMSRLRSAFRKLRSSD